MQRFSIEPARVPEILRPGLKEILEACPERFGHGADAIPLSFEPGGVDEVGLAVSKGQAVCVQFGRLIGAFRALGRLLGEGPADTGGFAETSQFDMVGVMLDVSRNGVIKPKAMCALLRHYALMGLNTVLLYTEDTYEVPGEPRFGYLRGAYTQQELREIDTYASHFGIEVVPCIQALAHMAQVLQWPAYAPYVDTEQILLVDQDKTYELIEKMIVAASAPLRSNRIHIGMDEAKGLGTGRYKELHGDKSPFDIFNTHLERVRDICERQGVHPMIWSDMYFRLGSATHDYYDRQAVIPDEVVERIPGGVQLVYWDYYHLDEDFYCDWVDCHRALGSEPVVAGGVWTWNRFWATLPFSFKAIDACVGACRRKRVREVFMTLWGDGGTEVDMFSALPGLQYFAEHAYGQTAAVDPARLRAHFRGSCDADFDDWVRASDLDAVPCLNDPQASNANPSKFLFWQDAFLSIMDPHIGDADLTDHYQTLAKDLSTAAEKGGLARRLKFPALLASALTIKAHLRRRMAEAYKANDRERLQRIAQEEIPELAERVEALWTCHRQLWMELYKPFGWEVIERNYGAVTLRLQTVAARLHDYLSGVIKAIPELEAELLPVFDVEKGELPVVRASRVISPSVIK